MTRILLTATFVSVVSLVPFVQNPSAPSNFIKIDAPVFALTHARLIDGSGAPAREDVTVIVRDGPIASVGSAQSSIPAGASAIDLTGRTVVPGAS